MRAVDTDRLEEEPEEAGWYLKQSDIMAGVRFAIGMVVVVLLIAGGCHACLGGGGGGAGARVDPCYEHATNLAPSDDDGSSYIHCSPGQTVELVELAQRPVAICRCRTDRMKDAGGDVFVAGAP